MKPQKRIIFVVLMVFMICISNNTVVYAAQEENIKFIDNTLKIIPIVK